MDRAPVTEAAGTFLLVFLVVFAVEGVVLATPLWTTVPVGVVVGLGAAALVYRRDRSG